MKKIILFLFAFLVFNFSYSDNHNYGWRKVSETWLIRSGFISVKNNKRILTVWLKNIMRGKFEGTEIVSLVEAECPYTDKNGEVITSWHNRRFRTLTATSFDSEGKITDLQIPNKWKYIVPDSDFDIIFGQLCFWTLDDDNINVDLIEMLFSIK